MLPPLSTAACTPALPAAAGARFVPKCEGQISPLGDIVRIGADASGLLVSPTQITGRHAS